MSDVLAYFLTWTTYGTWLPGDARGWVNRHPQGDNVIAPPSPALEWHARRLMEEAGAAPMVLNAQFHTKSFYKALGFSAVGDIFDEAGIEHVRMIRNR